MSTNQNCFFCQEVADNTANILSKPRVVYETLNFIAFPTVGCFKVGYLLILPKHHYLSFGELSVDLLDELNDMVKKITDFIQREHHQNCIIFEHGTVNADLLTTTSVMHAHIHIVPFNGDIWKSLPMYCEVKKIKGFSDLSKERDNYLFLRDNGGTNYIIKNANYPSQFLRQIICNALGISKFWDWKKYTFVENIEITLDYYKNLSSK